MPLDKGKLQKLYSTLQQGGYSQSYDEFEKGFTGNDNYPNRKKVYDLLTEHGADIGNNYEDFMKKMYTPAASSPAPSYSQQRTQAPAPKPQPKPAPKPKPRPKPKPKGGGMTAAERAQFIRNAQGIVHHSAAGLQRVKNQIDYANSNRGLKVNPVHLGQNSKVVRRHANGTVAKPRPVFDVAPEQQPGDTYLTESGNEFTSRAEADTEQNAVDQYRYDQSETGQLNNAYAEAERLDKLLEQRGKELDAENQDKWWRDLPRGGGGAVSTMNANDNNGRMTDTEYLNLLAARKKVDEQIRDLKAARDEKTGTFLGGLWRGFRDYAFDPSNWDNGYRDLLTTSAMLRAKTGAAQTPREKASERMMMEDTYKAGEAAQKAEEALGNGYRWARITAQALPYGLQFMAGNAIGMTGGIARAGEGMGVKLARKIAIKQGANNMMRNIARCVLKNTGVALGDLGAATALTNTVQAAQTWADIGHRYAGDVTYDPKTDDYKLEGGKSLGRSIYEGEANSIIENYTEMLGEHMHFGKFAKWGLNKVGLGKVSDWFTKVGKTDFMQGVNKYMKMAGFNGYPQEVMEEEVGIPLHAIFDGGNKMSDLLDGRQQLDIVGGMLFSMAGMGGASMVMQGGHKAAMAVQYHQDQHKLDNADKVASFRLTADKWAPIKEEIDGTTNEDFGKVMKDVLSNDELSDQEKQAVWDYAQRLIIMRGHNMGQEAATRNGMTDKETNTANESYTQGYNTTDPAAMNDARNTLAAAQQRLDGIFGENTDAQQILDAKNEDGSPYFTANDRKAAQAVVNAQQEYEGMMQRVRDDIDDEVQQTGAIYDSRTNSNGMIQSATLKAQNPDGTDKKVYITSGNVVMTDDGKSVDKQKSDMSIVVVDEDGKVQMISPDELFSLDTPIDGAQAKQQAIDAIQQSKAQEAADKINGKVNLTAGNTYTLTDNTGQQIEATIVADGQTGAVQNPDGTVNVSMNGKVVAMDVNTLQQMVDNTNMQKAEQGLDPRLTSRGTEQGAEDSEEQEQPTEQEGDQGILDQGGTVVPDDEGSGAVPSYPGSVVAPDVQEPHQWQVDDTFTIDNGGMPVRGQVTGVGEDGVEIYTESPVNGKKMQVVTPEELQSMTTEVNGETVQTPQDEAAAEQQPTEPSPTEENAGNGTNGVNGSNGVNVEHAQEQAPQTQEQAQPQQTEGHPQRAIDRIPSQQVDDGKGNVRTVHNWEQAEPGDTYDALTEIYHGNADRVKKGIDNRVGKIDKAIKGVQKKMDAIDNSDDFDEVAAQSEQYDQLQQQKDELEKQKKYWQGVQMVPRNRKMDADRRSDEEQAAAKAAQEKAEAEAAEKARQEREQVNGVPDVINDVPADARKRGFRNVNGMVVNRQGNTEGVTGRESNVKFSSTDTAKGHIKVIDADQLQPSHVSGQRNPSFFIDEAQPKDRTDTVSGMAAAKIAADLNPEEITGDGSAYQFSAPTVNSRGEVIQGNNRSDALKLMYSTPAFKPAQDAYKQYIADHAEEFGFSPEDVAKIQQMQHPVMVNELDVPDDEAIRLGQMRASDNESGGIERIDPVTTSQKLGGKVSSFANVLLSSPDEDASLSDVLMQNGAKAVKWLRTQGAISDTAAQSAFDKKGNLTPEARMDLQNILKQSLFQGGVSDLPTMFDKMPAKAQKAILSTFMRDFDSAESERILPEIQKAIEAWYGCAMANDAFAKASNYRGAKAAMHDWTLQTNLLDDNMPSDKFSNFAMELACRLQGCSMRETQQSLNDFFDLVQGKSQGDLFGGTTMGEQADRQESIRRIFNIEYKPISNNNGKTGSNAVADNGSQSGEGRQGSPTDGKGRERAESGSGSADGAGGTESHDEEVDDRGDSSHRDYSIHSGDSLGATSSSEKKETERQGVNTEPSEKQKEAGNYKKGHIKVDGYDITIENPKGSTRSGKDASGKAWSVPMHYDYGYIKGTEGVDGDHIDVYLSDNPTSGNVYVVDQIDQKTGKFDEHKVMYGFPSKEAAVEAYKGQYTDGWKVGPVTEVSREDFKKWVESSKRKTKPFSEYKSVKDAAAMQQPTEPSTNAGVNGVDGPHGVNGDKGKEKHGKTKRKAETKKQEPKPKTEHGTTETDTSVADSKRKQFDLFVRWDLERFIGKSKAKRVTVDWEHSEPENDYLPMKIDGEPSFVGVTEQDGEGDEIDRPIAIYDIAEGGDFPDVPKTAEFEAYAKDYNAENNLTENSDDYATMDANNPYVAFRSVDAAVKFNDWLHEKGKGAAAEQRRTEPSEKKENTRQREGNGAYTDEELSLINDPVAKWLGKSNRTKAQQRAFANRERKSMVSTVKELADRLHLDNVNIIMDASTLEGRKSRAKGFYDRNTNEITIVIPNHRDVEDVMQTLLHEGVAHYGLRKMFGSHFDTFLDNVYAAADNDVRRRITDLALKKYGGDFRVATEEYLASLAEQTDFEHIAETFWQKIKDFFLDMLHAIGFADFADKYDFTLSDNELRYILWRSYENLKEPGRYRSILGEAEDVAKQAELQVGDYSEAAAEPLQTERLTQKEREQKPNPAAMYGSARNSDYAATNDSAGEPEAWGKRDMLSKAEQVSHGIDPDLLFRDTIEDDDNTARETYNRMADEAKSRIREAWQDSMINVRNLQQAVLEQRGEKLEDYEDAYNAENRSHGSALAVGEYFTDNLYKPLLKAVDDVAKAAKVSVGDVTEYMMAKHGLERNIVFARRDADAAYKKAYDEAKGKYDALMNASRAESDPKKADALEKAANKVKFPDYDDIFNYLRMRDYAGLTSLTGQSDVQDAEAEAQRIVNDMESKALAAAQQRPTGPSNLIDELWKATNAATKWTLKKGYESGIISKDNYNYVSGMFNYYVPLRGWQEDTAGDLFDYVGSGDKGTAFSPTLHKAKGRRSEADNPIAYIGNMAVSAIVQGNKNKVKQTFLAFVENHPTNLVTVSEMWYRNFGTDTDPDWREDVPNIPEDATADEVADIVKQHEDMMEQLEDLGKATKKRGRLHLGVPVKKGQALEHHVEVMVNGKKYVLYINGNPRAAQALNGTRQRRASERSFESSKIARMGRLLAERYTSLSPSFTVSNALRDLTMAAITTLIKESPAYAMRFRLNVLKLGGPARMFTLMKWYKKAAAQQQPTGQMSETQKYFYEFMTEGAETGFTSLKEIDEYKKDMEKMYRNMNQKLLNPKRLFRGLSQGLEYANRCIEDMTRFAIYMASRQSGRNVKRSVNDAKNVTLNFNRKGSGEMGNSTYRNLQIFVNPAIQSLQNVGKMAKDHPVRFTLLTGSIALIGAAQVFATQLLWSVFGGGGDGDDDDWNAVDEYWKLPSWQRRNNLVMWIPGTKKFAMIPLAQEFRVFHGFGETMTTVMEGKSGENPALEVLTQASDLLPLDFAGNNGNPLVNLAPTVTQPLLQVGFNTDFTGRPLYKDNDFNKYEPSFQKAYVGTPSWLIKSSEFINDITGGDDHMQGWWERTKVGKELNNPAVVDHILKGYYGGMYSFLAQLGGTMYTLGTGNMPDAQEVPVVNRVITAPRETEQGGKQKLPDWYYDLSEENARQQNEFSGYKKDYMKGDAAGQKKFNELINSKDFQKWQKVNTYIGAVQQIRTAMNYTKDPNEKAELEKSLAEVLGELKKMKDE